MGRGHNSRQRGLCDGLSCMAQLSVTGMIVSVLGLVPGAILISFNEEGSWEYVVAAILIAQGAITLACMFGSGLCECNPFECIPAVVCVWIPKVVSECAKKCRKLRPVPPGSTTEEVVLGALAEAPKAATMTSQQNESITEAQVEEA
ncbi:unnamed protein product [Polarella glacialis]|uniref:Uncharacterized protein n=1 Tax=Polarella glacialis TaxID=89957 RepID=A0A813IDH4_POLGL|nr:unnamed protein product [Polarella glacialis]CAE8648065.1 unnamed protein product [Polarella glacialis]CAE8685108.1 unnamed protein product [Polarella glacialis]